MPFHLPLLTLLLSCLPRSLQPWLFADFVLSLSMEVSAPLQLFLSIPGADSTGRHLCFLSPGQRTLPVITAKQMMLCWDLCSSAGNRSAQKEGSGTHSWDVRYGWLAHRITVCTSCYGSVRHCFLKWLRDTARSRGGVVIGRARLKLPWTYKVSENNSEHPK